MAASSSSAPILLTVTVFTISTLLLAGKLHYGYLVVTGNILAALVSVAWLIVAVLVARNTHNRRSFELPPSFGDLDTTM